MYYGKYHLVNTFQNGHSFAIVNIVAPFEQLFDNVRAMCPGVLLKLVAVEGDIMLPGLGLSQAATDMLAAEVSVVFHAAATVKFDEAIKLSLQMNVLGVKRMVELCHKMIQLVVSG